MRKLIMVEHDKHGIWYFSTQSKVARALDTTYAYLHSKMKDGSCTLKGWHIEEIDDSGDIISMYIDQPIFFTKDKMIRY